MPKAGPHIQLGPQTFHLTGWASPPPALPHLPGEDGGSAGVSVLTRGLRMSSHLRSQSYSRFHRAPRFGSGSVYTEGFAQSCVQAGAAGCRVAAGSRPGRGVPRQCPSRPDSQQWRTGGWAAGASCTLALCPPLMVPGPPSQKGSLQGPGGRPGIQGAGAFQASPSASPAPLPSLQGPQLHCPSAWQAAFLCSSPGSGRLCATQLARHVVLFCHRNARF